MTSNRAFLYQIAYSDETWNSVPANFLPLDNRSNERPDWREYWPIRRFLQQETLDEHSLYGFVSPRFAEKLKCSAQQIAEFVSSVEGDIDVAAFSPFIDLRCMFRNVFEQGEFWMPGHMDLARKVFEKTLPGVDLRELVNTSTNAIYCNYFAAKPRFWRKWLALGEDVFGMAESAAHPLAPALNRAQVHRGEAQAKVFIAERLASLILATSSDFKISEFQNSTWYFPGISNELIITLDTLKLRSGSGGGQRELLNAFYHIQREILNGEAAQRDRLAIISRSIAEGIAHAPSRGYEHWGSAPAGVLHAQGQIGAFSLLRRKLWR